MKCEGVWKVEITTPYGWERVATAFMRNGEYLAASANHYSIGKYKQDGDNLEILADVVQYGDLRTVFGLKTSGKLQVKSKCKIGKTEILGKSKARGKKKYDILIRLTRLDTLD